ncbi:MAG: UPF0149 family protein [Candidatus Sulfotelmatobacter sp.]
MTASETSSRTARAAGRRTRRGLDGFFAALIAGPKTVMPSEYYPEVFGGEMSDTCEFGSLDEANEMARGKKYKRCCGGATVN